MAKAQKKIPVRVAPNMEREQIWLDKHGNEIDGPRGRIISKAEDDIEIPLAETAEKQAPSSNPLEALIKAKVEEAVINSISNIDIGKMVEDAIGKAFGGK